MVPHGRGASLTREIRHGAAESESAHFNGRTRGLAMRMLLRYGRTNRKNTAPSALFDNTT